MKKIIILLTILLTFTTAVFAVDNNVMAKENNNIILLNGNQPVIPDDPNFIGYEDLPETFGTSLGDVFFTVENYNVIVTIVYNTNAYFMTYIFDDNTDMELFETIEAYFMNITNRPQIIINNSDRNYLRDILEAPEDEKPAFVPHTIWDLKTNQLEIKDKYAANIYIKNNAKGVMIAYVYIDEYVIDEIISATLSWTSRTRKEYLFGLFKDWTEWENYEATFSNEDYLKYKNLTSNWQNQIPGWNAIRGIYQNLKTFEMPRIAPINVDSINTNEYNISKPEVEKYFKLVNPDFENLNQNPRYKLWAFALEPNAVNEANILFSSVFGSAVNKYTEFYHDKENPTDPYNFQIINIDYITNGKLYTAVGSEMNHWIYVDKGLQPKEDDNKLAMIIGIVIIAVYLVLIFKSGAYLKGENIIKLTVFYIIVLVLIYLAYIFLIPQIPSLFNLILLC